MPTIYVSSVKGRLVPRYSTLVNSSTTYIGATRDCKKIEWNTERVVPISEKEFNMHRREYKRAIQDRSLIKRTEEQYKAFLEADRKRRQNEREARKVESEQSGNTVLPETNNSQSANADEGEE